LEETNTLSHFFKALHDWPAHKEDAVILFEKIKPLRMRVTQIRIAKALGLEV